MHPERKDRVVKVALPGRSPRDKRKSVSLRKKIRPLIHFDDNEVELRNVDWIRRKWGNVDLIPSDYQRVYTDLGPGVSSELFRDDDGLICKTLESHIWIGGLTEELQAAIDDFHKEWEQLAIPTRTLMLHNIIVQRHEGTLRLRFIDDFGFADFLPFVKWSRTLQKRKVKRRLAEFRRKIAFLAGLKAEGKRPTRYEKFIEKMQIRDDF